MWTGLLRTTLRMPTMVGLNSERRAISQLHVNNPNIYREHSHVTQVAQLLRSHGILKIQLQFPDSHGTYLEKLVLNLNKYEGHGLPITHSTSRGWFWDVRPTKESLTERARSETMEEFPWHTDCSYEACPPRFFALHVLQPDRCGGGTLSALEVAKLLSHLSPATRQQLAQPEYEMRVPPEFIKDGGGRTIVGSILAPDTDETCPQMRFRDDIITPLTPGATRAFQELKDILGSPGVKDQVLDLTPQQLPEGSIIIIDNRRWLHARNHVRDPNRHLRRIRWNAQAFGTSLDTL